MDPIFEYVLVTLALWGVAWAMTLLGLVAFLAKVFGRPVEAKVFKRLILWLDLDSWAGSILVLFAGIAMQLIIITGLIEEVAEAAL